LEFLLEGNFLNLWNFWESFKNGPKNAKELQRKDLKHKRELRDLNGSTNEGHSLGEPLLGRIQELIPRNGRKSNLEPFGPCGR